MLQRPLSNGQIGGTIQESHLSTVPRSTAVSTTHLENFTVLPTQYCALMANQMTQSCCVSSKPIACPFSPTPLKSFTLPTEDKKARCELPTTPCFEKFSITLGVRVLRTCSMLLVALHGKSLQLNAKTISLKGFATFHLTPWCARQIADFYYIDLLLLSPCTFIFVFCPRYTSCVNISHILRYDYEVVVFFSFIIVTSVFEFNLK